MAKFKKKSDKSETKSSSAAATTALAEASTAPLGPDTPNDAVDGMDVYSVKLPGNAERRFHAHGEDHAITLYNRHFGITSTVHEYSVVNVTDKPLKSGEEGGKSGGEGEGEGEGEE